MASGHVNRANRPNTRLHRPTCNVNKALANSEPSTHGALRKSASGRQQPAMTRMTPLPTRFKVNRQMRPPPFDINQVRRSIENAHA